MKKLFQNYLALLLIGMIGSFFRFWGLSYDLPNVYTQDESRIMDKAVEVADGNMRHGLILFGSLPVYTVGAAIRITALFVPRIKAGFPTFVESAQHNMTYFYVIGRSVSALYGLIEIFFLYWLGVIFFGRNAALLSTLFLAISRISIEYAHYVTPDTALSATMLLSIVVASIAYRKQNAVLFVLSGMLSGLSAAQKFPGILTLSYTFMLLFLVDNSRLFTWKKKSIYACLIIGACIASYIASYPYILTDFRLFIEQWRWMSGTMRYWDRPPYYDFGVTERIRTSILWLHLGIGTFIFYLSVVGLIASLRVSSILPRTLSFFILLFFLFNTFPVKQATERYLPLIPYLSLYASWTTNYVSSRFFPKNKRLEHTHLLWTAFTILFISIAPLLKSFFLVASFSYPDTRDLLRQWLTDHRLNEQEIVRDPWTGDESMFTSDPANPNYSHQLDRMTHKQTVSSLKNFQYAIVSDEFAQWYYYWERFYPQLHTVTDVFRSIETDAEKITEFKPRITNIDREDLDFLLDYKNWKFDQIRGTRIVVYEL